MCLPYKSFENTVGKGEIVCYEQFLLFLQCFLPVWRIFCHLTHYPLLKDFADNNFKFDENGRKLSKWEENNVGKGEIVHYEQFLHFPQCFQEAYFSGASKGVIVWEWVKLN